MVRAGVAVTLSRRGPAFSDRRLPMFPRSWIRRLFATHVPRVIRKAPARFRPRLESLEDRLAPATFDVAAGDVGGLVAAINAANDESLNPGPDTINLTRSPISPYGFT